MKNHYYLGITDKTACGLKVKRFPINENRPTPFIVYGWESVTCKKCLNYKDRPRGVGVENLENR